MNRLRQKIVTATMVAAGVAGGAMGAAWVIGSPASAAPSPAPSSSNGTATNSGPGGTFKPNEDATHEQGESAAREAQEDAGQVPTVP
jgi:hypothetical protein